MVSQHKIGLISDIHADLWGLEKSLALFQKHKVSDVFCAGDLVDGGKDGIYVIRTIQQNAIPCVSGNHDRDAFAHQSWIRRSIRQSNKCDHPFLLPSPMVGYITSLPLIYQFQLSGITICLAHGTPSSNTDYLFPDASHGRICEAIKHANVDVLVLGHTHRPMQINVGAKMILNPGSTFTNRGDATKTCAILTLPDRLFQVFDLKTGELYRHTRREVKCEEN